MALITCPECSGNVSDKAYSCPHCGFPMQGQEILEKPRKATRKRRANGLGSIVPLRRKSGTVYEVRVNTRIDERGYPQYDVVGRYTDRVAADTALAEYNTNPYDIDLRNLTFTEVFKRWYKSKFKVEAFHKGKKTSNEYTVQAGYKHCKPLHDRIYSTIHAEEMQELVDNKDISHSTAEHVLRVLKGMGEYAMQFDIIRKNYAEFVKMTKEEDTEPGKPFTESELALLWQHKDFPFVDTILIYCYSGFRINELAKMPLDDIDLENRTFTGGLKTKYSRGRTIPIHSRIYELVKNRYDRHFASLIYHDGTRDISEIKYREHFDKALKSCGITDKYTPQDCRHTCNSLLIEKKTDRIVRYKIMGHTGKDINEKIYSHITVKQMREELEKI
ncbi:MAG: tyrosine-type recombinase/integrase [Lachnospiraceae bacterium]|nr:tyrosine-type recombinase/integrase [Lachnospiraceae bacterium]